MRSRRRSNRKTRYDADEDDVGQLPFRLCEGASPRRRSHIFAFPVGSGTLGDLRVARLQKAQVRALLAAKRGEGRARNSVRIIHATLRALLSDAVEDELLTIKLTVDTYGEWLKMRDTAAADRLDGLPVSEPVSEDTGS